MPSFTVFIPACAEVITTLHASSDTQAGRRTLRTGRCQFLRRAIGQLPRASTALLVMLGTLLSPLAAVAGGPKVTLDTSQGVIVLELDEERAPQTVKNFLEYVDSGFYDETLFHRVIEGFMIQGGGFNQKYHKKPTHSPVSNEAYNGLRNRQYSIAMARTTAPHSATSQFFINSADNTNLNHTDTTQRGWGYTVFGRVVEGKEIVDAISRVRTGAGGPFSRDVPTEPVIILSASRVQQPDTAAATDGSDQSASGDSSSTSSQPKSESATHNLADNEPRQPVEQN